MKIKYLGTAAAEGIPAIFCKCELCKKAKELDWKDIRTRSQAIIDGKLLIDFPPDSYMHMLTQDLELPNIEHIIFTHSHQDHFYDLDLTMRGKGFSDLVDKTLYIYGNDKIGRAYEKTTAEIAADLELDKLIAYKETVEFVPRLIMDYKVTPLLANHDRNEKCLIYIIEKDDKAILYANDTGLFPDATWTYLSGKHLDLVSMDCTMGGKKEGTNHMGLPDNVELVEKLKSLNCVDENTKYVITHFSHHGGLLHAELEKQAGQHGFAVAYDGYEVEV